MSFAYQGWRRQWGQRRLCGGALVWQLNDCWPVTSWSIVDYFMRKKPAYYVIRRALAPVAVAVKRSHHDWSVVHARPAKASFYELWVASSRLEEQKATVELRFISIATGEDIKAPIVRENISIVPNGTTEVLSGRIDNTEEEPHVLAARLYIDGELVSRDTDWPQPLKYLDFSDRGLEIVANGHRDWLRITAKRPTKGLVFEEHPEVILADNALDIMPGDERVMGTKGPQPLNRPIRFTYLGDTEILKRQGPTL